MLLKALTALHQSCDPARDEVFVVDNGSEDGSADVVARDWPQVHLIRNTCNNGFARANNQAIARAGGEFIVLLNNDAFLEPDGLDRIARTFAGHPRAAVVAGQLVDNDGREQHSARRLPTALAELGLGFLRRAPRHPRPQSAAEVESVVGACMAVRRAAIREAGSLDDDFFFYFEETEWCHRFRRFGWTVILDPAVRVTHLKGASTRGRRTGAQIEMFRSRLTFYFKTMSWPTAAALATYRVLRLAINTLVHLVTVTLTLGLASSPRNKLVTYWAQLAWLLRGCPWEAGLPGKCPRDFRGASP